METSAADGQRNIRLEEVRPPWLIYDKKLNAIDFVIDFGQVFILITGIFLIPVVIIYLIQMIIAGIFWVF